MESCRSLHPEEITNHEHLYFGLTCLGTSIPLHTPACSVLSRALWAPSGLCMNRVPSCCAQTKCCVLMLDWDDTSMVCEVAEVLLEALRCAFFTVPPQYPVLILASALPRCCLFSPHPLLPAWVYALLLLLDICLLHRLTCNAWLQRGLAFHARPQHTLTVLVSIIDCLFCMV